MTQLVQGFGLKKLYYKLNMTIIKYYERLFILKFGCQKRGQEHEHIDSSVVRYASARTCPAFFNKRSLRWGTIAWLNISELLIRK